MTKFIAVMIGNQKYINASVVKAFHINEYRQNDNEIAEIVAELLDGTLVVIETITNDPDGAHTYLGDLVYEINN